MLSSESKSRTVFASTLPTLAFLVAATLSCLLADTSAAQQIGDRVVVTANFETKILKKKVGEVYGGSIHTVTAIDGKWCALEGVKGWLPLQYVMNLEMAKEHYDERIKENEQDWTALAHRGMIHYENEEYAKAFTDLNESLKINKQNALTWSNRGIVLNAQQKYDLAIRDLAYAVKLQPKFARGHYNIGLVYYGMGANELAIESFDRAIELEKEQDSENPWSYVSRGSARMAMGDTEGAEADYRRSIEINKRIADAYLGLSNIYLADDQLDKAHAEADKAVDAQPRNAMALNARGWILYKQGKLDDAMYDLNRAIRYAPRLPLAYSNRGICRVKLGHFDKAISDHNTAIEIGGKSPLALMNRGVAYFGKGDFAKAKADFDAAEAAAEDFAEALNASAWFMSTCPDAKYRDGAKALEKAKKACELGDWKVAYHIDTYAAALAETGDFDKAIEYVQKAMEIANAEEKELCELELAEFRQKKPYRTQQGISVGENVNDSKP